MTTINDQLRVAKQRDVLRFSYNPWGWFIHSFFKPDPARLRRDWERSRKRLGPFIYAEQNYSQRRQFIRWQNDLIGKWFMIALVVGGIVAGGVTGGWMGALIALCAIVGFCVVMFVGICIMALGG